MSNVTCIASICCAVAAMVALPFSAAVVAGAHVSFLFWGTGCLLAVASFLMTGRAGEKIVALVANLCFPIAYVVYVVGFVYSPH